MIKAAPLEELRLMSKPLKLPNSFIRILKFIALECRRGWEDGTEKRNKKILVHSGISLFIVSGEF